MSATDAGIDPDLDGSSPFARRFVRLKSMLFQKFFDLPFLLFSSVKIAQHALPIYQPNDWNAANGKPLRQRVHRSFRVVILRPGDLFFQSGLLSRLRQGCCHSDQYHLEAIIFAFSRSLIPRRRNQLVQTGRVRRWRQTAARKLMNYFVRSILGS